MFSGLFQVYRVLVDIIKEIGKTIQERYLFLFASFFYFNKSFAKSSSNYKYGLIIYSIQSIIKSLFRLIDEKFGEIRTILGVFFSFMCFVPSLFLADV